MSEANPLLTVQTRPSGEIQKAHDLLVGVLLGELPHGLGEEELTILNACAGVLCWTLRHDHNPTFEHTIKGLEKLAISLGYSFDQVPTDNKS